MAISESELIQASQRMQTLRNAARASAARYDEESGRVMVELNTCVHFSFPAALAEGLANAKPSALRVIEISPSGLGLRWPNLDADLYVPSLLQGILGTRSTMAAVLGTTGGSTRSESKAASARANALKGGRPAHKNAAAKKTTARQTAPAKTRRAGQL